MILIKSESLPVSRWANQVTKEVMIHLILNSPTVWWQHLQKSEAIGLLTQTSAALTALYYSKYRTVWSIRPQLASGRGVPLQRKKTKAKLHSFQAPLGACVGKGNQWETWSWQEKNFFSFVSRMELTTNNDKAEITKQHLFLKIGKFKNHISETFCCYF